MDKLPVELLAEVINHLPQSDQVKVSEVCRKFRDVIEKFELIKILFVAKNTKSDSFLPTRKYFGAVVKKYNPDTHQKVFEAVGEQLNTIKFAHCSINLMDVLNILQTAPNVKDFTFSYVRLENDKNDGTIPFPKLVDVNLLFEETDPEIFNVFKESSLLKVDLRFFADVPYSNFSAFVNLLKTQKKLKSFAVSGIYESNLFLIPMGKAGYRLQEFFIDNCDFEEWDGLESFLAEHCETLEKITVKNLRWDPSSVLNHCVSLKNLQCHRTELNFLGKLFSVKQLLIEPPTRTMDSFPNSIKLFLSRSSPEANQVVSRSMQKLKELELKFSTIKMISFATLKKLKLSSIDGEITSDFFDLHQKVDDLTLENCFSIDDALLEAIVKTLTALKTLRILGDNRLTSRSFTIVRNNCKSIKTFEMSKWNQKFKTEDWNCLYNISGMKVYTEKL